MAITLSLPAVLAPFAAGARDLSVTGSTVGAAVEELGVRFPALKPRLAHTDGRPHPFVTFYVNDEDVRFLGGFETTLNDGDEITVVPAVAGG
ncbi:MAG: MoaD/ThiS family protein [Gemmatimonadaceae bacterium]